MTDTHRNEHSDNTAARMMMYDAQKKSALIAYLLWFFLGGIGAHRYYTGATGSAIFMTILFVLSIVLSVVIIGGLGFLILGIWWIIDAFLIPGLVRTFNIQLAHAYGQ